MNDHASAPLPPSLSMWRKLLCGAYASESDWNRAALDLARTVHRSVRAQLAMVALWQVEEDEWKAVTSNGARLEEGQLERDGSLSTLERVRTTGRPHLSRREKPSEREGSVAGLLAVPMFRGEGDDRVFAGSLYAQHTAIRPPFRPEDVELMAGIARVAEPLLSLLLLAECRAGSASCGTPLELGSYRTRDPAFGKAVLGPLRRAARVDRVGLLLQGPTGSGKSHLAEAYHRVCPRRRHPFVTVNCGSFQSAATLGPELFGFAPSSGYQNAPPRGRPGKAQLAHRGTLFLDEIGCLPTELQPQLLRLVERGRFSPLGSSAEQEVDIQIIAATNADLDAAVEVGSFREDLYWRLCDLVVTLPPLSERTDDLELLIDDLLARVMNRTKRSDIDGLTPAALERLRGVDWGSAGNVRGLEKTLERSVILAPPGCGRLGPAELVLRQGGPGGSEPTRERPDGELESVKAAIRKYGKATQAARALGISYRELYWKLQKAGLTVHRVLLE